MERSLKVSKLLAEVVQHVLDMENELAALRLAESRRLALVRPDETLEDGDNGCALTLVGSSEESDELS